MFHKGKTPVFIKHWEFMLRLKPISILTTVFITISLALAGTSAIAAGVNDVNNVVRYGNDGRVIGTVVSGIEDSDDDAELMQAPWPMNFFGRKYDGLCVTSNGTISPVVFASANCSDDYDQNMADLASSYQSPVIAAFANDNDLGNAVLDWETEVATFSADNQNVVTITTSTPHGLNTGDSRSIYLVSSSFNNSNSNNLRTDDYWFQSVSMTVVNATTLSFDGSAPQASNGSSVAANYPAGITNVTKGWVWDQSSPNQNGIDDGVGKVNTVYAGTTTIDGRDAWVYTDYRSVTYEDDNPQILTNTFQIVLIKRDTPTGSTDGFNFDIEYNYGAIMDGGDGYDADSMNCGAMSDGCRTGVGLVDWDPVANIADVYELFGSTPSRDLVDWYSSGMTSNRLNSSLNGRYTFSKVNGQVQDFAQPVMDGSGTTVARPTIASPTDPVPSESGKGIGESSLLEDGSAVPVNIIPNNTSNGIVASASSYLLTLAALDDQLDPLPLDSEGRLILKQEGFISTSGEGFTANSPVKVYMYSNPTYVGMLYTDSNGAFSGNLSIPSGLQDGVHNIQVIAYDAAGNVKVLTLAVWLSATGEVLATTGTSGMFTALGLLSFMMISGISMVLISRRKETFHKP